MLTDVLVMMESFFYKIRIMAACFFDSGEKREMLRGSGISFVMRVAAMGLSYLSWLLIAKIYGVTVLGGFSLAMAVFSIFSLLGAQGARDAIVRFVSESVSSENSCGFIPTYKQMLLIFAGLSVFTGTLLFFCADFLSNFVFSKPELERPLKFMAVGIPLSAVTYINIATLRGLKRIAEASFLSLIFPVAMNLVLVIVLSFIWGQRTESVVAAYAGSLAVSGFLGVLLLFGRKNKTVKGCDTVKPSVREVITVATPMLVSSGMIMIFSWVDTFMLGVFCSSDVVGIYRTAFKISTLTGFSLNAVGSIAAAQFAAANKKGNKAKLEELVSHSARLIFWTTLPLAVALFVFGGFVMNIFGSEFSQGEPALRILVAAQMFNALCGLVGILLNICGGQRQFRNAIVITSVLNIFLNIWLIPRYGASGAAVATALSIVAGNILASLAAIKLFGYWAGFRFGLKKEVNDKT